MNHTAKLAQGSPESALRFKLFLQILKTRLVLDIDLTSLPK